MKLDELKAFVKEQFDKAETPEAIETGVKLNALIEGTEKELTTTQDALKKVKDEYSKLLTGASSTDAPKGEPKAHTFEEILKGNAVKGDK